MDKTTKLRCCNEKHVLFFVSLCMHVGNICLNGTVFVFKFSFHVEIDIFGSISHQTTFFRCISHETTLVLPLTFLLILSWMY